MFAGAPGSPAGAILALPLTIGVKILFDAFPATATFGALLSAEAADEPPRG